MSTKCIGPGNGSDIVLGTVCGSTAGDDDGAIPCSFASFGVCSRCKPVFVLILQAITVLSRFFKTVEFSSGMFQVGTRHPLTFGQTGQESPLDATFPPHEA